MENVILKILKKFLKNFVLPLILILSIFAGILVVILKPGKFDNDIVLNIVVYKSTQQNNLCYFNGYLVGDPKKILLNFRSSIKHTPGDTTKVLLIPKNKWVFLTDKQDVLFHYLKIESYNF